MEYLIRRKLDMENNEQVMGVHLGFFKERNNEQIIRQMRVEQSLRPSYAFVFRPM